MLSAFAIDHANNLKQQMYSELQSLTLVGLIGVDDPPRKNVRKAIDDIQV